MKKFMPKVKKEDFVLTMNPKYVPSWGKWEAFREIMQNVIDRQTEYSPAEMIFSYNPNKQRIIVGNKLTRLEKKTLILGETTKANNNLLIGQYGEGYKLALLVFLRMGIRVRIRDCNEIWIPSIKFSEKFDTDLLTITVMPAEQSDNLIFEIDGVTLEDYELFKKNCLIISPPAEKISTSLGDILTEDKFRSKLFVGGLFICDFAESEKIRYGYNMLPGMMELDRDRKKVGTFNLLWQLGLMYGDLDSTYANFVFRLKQEEWRDIDYYDTHSFNRSKPLYNELCSLHYSEFIAKYGVHAIAVQSEEEANFVKEKYNHLRPIVLKEKVYKFIQESSGYKASKISELPVEETPYGAIERIVGEIITDQATKETLLAALRPLARNWYKRNY